MGWNCHSLADAENQRSRGPPGFLPGASDPDHGLHILPSNPGDQVWQRGPPPPGNLPPGLEYLSQVLFSLYFCKVFFPLRQIQTWFLPLQSRLKPSVNNLLKWEKHYTICLLFISITWQETFALFYNHFYFPYLPDTERRLNIFDWAV